MKNLSDAELSELVTDDRNELMGYYLAITRCVGRGGDGLHGVPSRQGDLAALRINIAMFAKDAHVLELGCGLGFWTDLLCKNGRQVIAVDFVSEALTIARSRIAANNLTLICANFLADNFEMNGVDAVAIFFVLSHFSDKEIVTLFERLQKRVRPCTGVRVLIVDNLFSQASRRRYPCDKIDSETFERRTVSSGETFLIRKNGFDEVRFRRLLGDYVDDIKIRTSTYFYQLSCTLRSSRIA